MESLNKGKGVGWNVSVKSIESYCSWSIECMDLHRGVGILENRSLESDIRDKSDLNEAAYQ